MNKINMPGFTAEESLDIGKARYITTRSESVSAEADVRPQRASDGFLCEHARGEIISLYDALGYYAGRGDWHEVHFILGKIQIQNKNMSEFC